MSERPPKWKDVAPEVAERLGLAWLPGRKVPQITGELEGLPVAIDIRPGGENTPPSTQFSVTLPGWPTASGLAMRWGRPILFKRRYMSFDDSEFDGKVMVKARAPDLVRAQLTRVRRAAYLAAVQHIFEADMVEIGRKRSVLGSDPVVRSRQSPPRIKGGVLATVFSGVVTIPDVAVDTAQRLAELGATLNG
jgi:hypothetical protein